MPASIIVLIALAAVTATVALYRKMIARREDDSVHIADPSGYLISNQLKMARKLKWIDRVGIGLTVFTALYGIGIFAIEAYTRFTKPPM